MSNQLLLKSVYEDLSCYVLEQIGKGKDPRELDKEYQDMLPGLAKAGFLSKNLHLNKKGKEYLSQAIKSARDENRSALTYAGTLTGFTITFFALTLPVFLEDPVYPRLFIYLMFLLLLAIFLSVLAGFCFWHGCSLEHGWKDLRIFNETGDATIIFDGWITLYTVYLVLFLSLARLDLSLDIPFWGNLIYFLIPGMAMFISIVHSWRALISRRSEVRTADKTRALADVVCDFLIISAFFTSGGDRFFRPKDIPRRGRFILIMLSVAFFSAIPILLLIL